MTIPPCPSGLTSGGIVSFYCTNGIAFSSLTGRAGGLLNNLIRDLAAKIKAMTGSSSPIVTIPYDQAYESGFEDMPRRVPDITKIRALIGYQPTVELDEILEAGHRVRSRPHEDQGHRAPRAADRCFGSKRSRSGSCCSPPGAIARPILPEIVQIESTNICNAKCVFCPRDDMHRRQGVMSLDLFKKVVDECAELGITHVRVHNYGEPFLDRHLTAKVRYAKEKGIKEVGMISNGSLITEKIARGVIEAGLDAINISVDAGGKTSSSRRGSGSTTTRSSPTSSGSSVSAASSASAARNSSCRSCARTTPPTSRPSSSTGATSPTRFTSPSSTTGAGR